MTKLSLTPKTDWSKEDIMLILSLAEMKEKRTYHRKLRHKQSVPIEVFNDYALGKRGSLSPIKKSYRSHYSSSMTPHKMATMSQSPRIKQRGIGNLMNTTVLTRNQRSMGLNMHNLRGIIGGDPGGSIE